MSDIFLVMLISLAAMAVIDLVVGVSNDAVNFLNSAIGSKVATLRTIMIVASIGVAVGAIFSSGMMEVARKGIFVPEKFYFDEIMIIFTAVMLTDVLLLDVFNSMGLPTSTTVSIVFELLGAAVAVSLIKICNSPETIYNLFDYINTAKASEIILGILISIGIAFTAGVIIQFLARLVFTFEYKARIKFFGALFGGVSMTAITYFILIKGISGVSFISKEQLLWISDNTSWLLVGNFIFWLIFSQSLLFLKINLLKFIILAGTFALALAFAGNDLVNFIGVPIAASYSYNQWIASGQEASLFGMGVLNGEVRSQELFLFIAGLIMVLTLWFSKKAKTVVETGVNLSRQHDGHEKFSPNFLSRAIVRLTIYANNAVNLVLPKSILDRIEKRFKLVEENRSDDKPAFDLIRAAVNLALSGILISIGTSMKLPLSTTYVTFMVAMGTSLADRAWGRESAVYRVAGVFNVIGGWFITALVAFISAAFFAALLFYGKLPALILLLMVAAILLTRSFIVHKKRDQVANTKKRFNKKDIITINEIITESSHDISEVIKNVNALYSNTMDHLAYQDLGKLKKNKKNLLQLEKQVDDLRSDVFYFIKSLDESSVEASRFYIMILGYLQDMVQSIGFIVKNSHSHVNNNHKKLKFNQIRDLKGIDTLTQNLFDRIDETFQKAQFKKLDSLLKQKQELLEHVNLLIEKQVARIRTTETSPKNTKLYFGLLLETKDLVTSTMNLLQQFKEFHDEASKTDIIRTATKTK